ncbi:aspartate-semialdehyde dehydrogenase [Thiotrichales bacterium 19S11-10]|nr:aspartate-semialdehyde dehydrogenase [Thiotrichales bacterium 19S11-10]
MNKLGMVGWRGMVGSVLVDQMLKNNDFDGLETTLFSTSQHGQKPPSHLNLDLSNIENAYDINSLKQMDILISCQGGDYTNKVYSDLKATGWDGYWIDAASVLRMQPDSIIVLDPINRTQIDNAINQGVKSFIGGNCTVSLMMLAIDGLLQNNLVESISAMTYQAISGAGAKAIKELLSQHQYLITNTNSEASALAIEESLKTLISSADFPSDTITAPLSFNVLPWIDIKMEGGQTKEEWKAYSEMNKILDSNIPIDGICVRVPTLRAHSQALTIKLNKDLDLSEIESIIQNANQWIRYVPNEKENTLQNLTPLSVSGNYDIAVGRLKKSKLGSDIIHLFTVGDQLLWGAAEPLRRMLNILRGKL